MAGLADTASRLKQLGRNRDTVRAAPPTMVETAGFGPNPGALRMLTYRPEGWGDGMPLVVTLHGCAQRAETFAPGWLAHPGRPPWLRGSRCRAHGIPLEAGAPETLPGRTRTVWPGPDPRRPLMELNLVHGLGHGVPLSTLGEAGVGSAGPYMLEAGISSSLEIAHFWGVATVAAGSLAPPSERSRRPAPAKCPALVARGGRGYVRSVGPRSTQAAGLHRGGLETCWAETSAMTDGPRRPTLRLKNPPTPAPAVEAAIRWKCKPCGTPFELSPNRDGADVIRCPTCNARLGRADQFRGRSEPVQGVRARRAERAGPK